MLREDIACIKQGQDTAKIKCTEQKEKNTGGEIDMRSSVEESEYKTEEISPKFETKNKNKNWRGNILFWTHPENLAFEK